MPIFLVNALAALGKIPWGAIGGFMLKYWYAFVIALLLASNAFTLHQKNGIVAQLKTEKAAHAADTKSYRDAQAAAQKLADAMKVKLQQENQEKADEADANYSTLLSKYRANLLRYQAAQGATRQPSTGQPDSTAPSYNGPSYGTSIPEGSMNISLKDGDICAVNTARLQAAHDWAGAIIAKDAKP